MKLIRLLKTTNHHTSRILCALLLSLSLNGCAAVIAIPAPIQIASNMNSGLTFFNLLDDDPTNDGFVMNYVKSLFGSKEEPEPIIIIADKEITNPQLNYPAPEIKL